MPQHPMPRLNCQLHRKRPSPWGLKESRHFHIYFILFIASSDERLHHSGSNYLFVLVGSTPNANSTDTSFKHDASMMKQAGLCREMMDIVTG